MTDTLRRLKRYWVRERHIHGEDQYVKSQIEPMKLKLMVDAADVERARLEWLRVDGMREAEIAGLRDAATARAERAEADAASMYGVLLWIEHNYCGVGNPRLSELVRNVLHAEHPGTRYLDLAQIVEGLPKYEGKIYVYRSTNLDGYEHYLVDATGQRGFICPTQETADALARLLAWRKEQG